MFFEKKTKASQIIWERRRKIRENINNLRQKLVNGEYQNSYPEFLAKELLYITEEQRLLEIYFDLKEKDL